MLRGGGDSPRSDETSYRNLTGGAWLIADMSLNIWALSIVKWLGADYPATQIVFLRAFTGLLLLVPVLWYRRGAFRSVPNLGLHLVRVGFAVITLTASFFAIARVPLATFTAIGFTRPLVTMLMASIILREVIGVRRWVAAFVALVGIVIAVNPAQVPWTAGLAALAVVVLSGSASIIATRALRASPTIVLMAFYTAGLTVCTAPFAAVSWVPVSGDHAVALIAIGCFAQLAQLCFLRAHYHGAAGVLSVLGYLSLIISVGVGYLVFEERPGLTFGLGAALVVGAAVWATADLRTLGSRR